MWSCHYKEEPLRTCQGAGQGFRCSPHEMIRFLVEEHELYVLDESKLLRFVPDSGEQYPTVLEILTRSVTERA